MSSTINTIATILSPQRQFHPPHPTIMNQFISMQNMKTAVTRRQHGKGNISDLPAKTDCEESSELFSKLSLHVIHSLLDDIILEECFEVI